MDSCLECAIEHVAKARILILESKRDDEYCIHFWYGVGQLGCAEDESIESYPAAAAVIRMLKLNVKNSQAGPDEFRMTMRFLVDLRRDEAVRELEAIYGADTPQAQA